MSSPAPFAAHAATHPSAVKVLKAATEAASNASLTKAALARFCTENNLTRPRLSERSAVKGGAKKVKSPAGCTAGAKTPKRGRTDKKSSDGRKEASSGRKERSYSRREHKSSRRGRSRSGDSRDYSSSYSRSSGYTSSSSYDSRY